MKTFRCRADWYKKRGIPHRRGYLLYGPPGTGKTSIIQAIAVSNLYSYVGESTNYYLQNSLELNVAFASLSSIGGNDTLSSLMSDLPHNSIIVMEDIDHLFESVTNTAKAASSTLTMSGLLNVLDGIQGQEGASKLQLCS